jgi:hypothetical protein
MKHSLQFAGMPARMVGRRRIPSESAARPAAAGWKEWYYASPTVRARADASTAAVIGGATGAMPRSIMP